MAVRIMPLDNAFQLRSARHGGRADAGTGGPGVSFNA
jgi:hypothetical protein